MTRALTIPVNHEYFVQIVTGAKPEEYRLRTDYWRKRLVGREYDAVVMTSGYPKGGGTEGLTRTTRKWQGYTEKTITHPHFGAEPVEVFAINVATPAGDPQ